MSLYKKYLREKKIYKVGGAVRDELLNKIHQYDANIHDIDRVAIGYTEEEFLQQFPKAQKVGNDFPVFLVNGEEVALGRIERKSGKGYKGFEVDFSPTVSIEDDLHRRDLTINSIAKDEETDEYIDPYGGLEDIKNKKLRHTGKHFSEDPLRVLRVARFASKFDDFEIDKETIKLMHDLKEELSTLTPERVWKETEKALTSKAPWRYFEVLLEANVLDVVFPELYKLVGVPAGKSMHIGERDAFDHTMQLLKKLKSTNSITRFSVICHDLGKGETPKDMWPSHHNHDQLGEGVVESLCDRLKAPSDYKKAGVMSSVYHMISGEKLYEMREGKIIKLLSIVKKFPSGLKEYYKIIEADSGYDFYPIVEKFMQVFDVKLPGEKQNLGKASGDYLLQLRISKLKKIKKELEI